MTCSNIHLVTDKRRHFNIHLQILKAQTFKLSVYFCRKSPPRSTSIKTPALQLIFEVRYRNLGAIDRSSLLEGLLLCFP
jgi:hypothetical protein